MTDSFNVQQEGTWSTPKFGFACQYRSSFWCDRH